MNYIIIGNGVTGIHAAETLRRLDPDSRIRVTSDEGFPPRTFQRMNGGN